MYKLIDGKEISKSIRSELSNKISLLKKTVGLAVVLVGNNSASQVYVKNKIKACEEVGIKSFAHYLPENTSQTELENLLKKLADDETVHGILVQLPLPKHISEDALRLIPHEKDVDGFSAENVGSLCLKQKGTVPCTPYGIMKMLEYENIDICGKNAVVVGRSNIVGKPIAMLLLNSDATVTVCHSKTKNLKDICKSADILIVAIGKAKFIKSDMVKDGAVVIDVGMNRDENGKLCGDVDFESVKEKCSHITPVPGGVGPMTITMLMYNTYVSAKRSLK